MWGVNGCGTVDIHCEVSDCGTGDINCVVNVWLWDSIC